MRKLIPLFALAIVLLVADLASAAFVVRSRTVVRGGFAPVIRQRDVFFAPRAVFVPVAQPVFIQRSIYVPQQQFFIPQQNFYQRSFQFQSQRFFAPY